MSNSDKLWLTVITSDEQGIVCGFIQSQLRENKYSVQRRYEDIGWNKLFGRSSWQANDAWETKL